MRGREALGSVAAFTGGFLLGRLADTGGELLLVFAGLLLVSVGSLLMLYQDRPLPPCQ